MEYKVEQYQLQQKVYSTQQSTKCTASSQHVSAARARSPGGTWCSNGHPTPRSRAPVSPNSFQLSSLLPEGCRHPQQHQMQAPASAVLPSICTGVNWLLKAKENQLSLAAKGEVTLFSIIQPPFLKAPRAIRACCPLPSFPMKEIIDSHTTTCTATTQKAPDFQQQREGEQNKEFMTKGYLVLRSDFVPDIV